MCFFSYINKGNIQIGWCSQGGFYEAGRSIVAAAQCSSVAGWDRNESMTVSEKGPIYAEDDWQVERKGP